MEHPRRKLHRLSSWDYSRNGYYHITICTNNKQKILASIHQAGFDAVVIPTAIGKVVVENWHKLPDIYPGVRTDYFCLMPNHIHGILIFDQSPEGARRTLSYVVRGFKSVVTREFNKIVPKSEQNKLWQSSFYDEIIRDDDMLFNVRKYILGNPSKWLDDPLFTE